MSMNERNFFLLKFFKIIIYEKYLPFIAWIRALQKSRHIHQHALFLSSFVLFVVKNLSETTRLCSCPRSGFHGFQCRHIFFRPPSIHISPASHSLSVVKARPSAAPPAASPLPAAVRLWKTLAFPLVFHSPSRAG